MASNGCWRSAPWWGRRAAIALLAMVPLHFLFFEVDYFTDYHRRAAFWFEWNHRGGVEEILARIAHDERPIFLSRSRDPVMESYWRFAALKHESCGSRAAPGVLRLAAFRHRVGTAAKPHPGDAQ